MIHLNRWQRIGIVVSLIWILGSVIYVRSFQVETAGVLFDFVLRTCNELTSAVQERDKCIDDAVTKYTNWLSIKSVDLENIALASLGPVIAGWLLIFLSIRIVRWVNAGKKFDEH